MDSWRSIDLRNGVVSISKESVSLVQALRNRPIFYLTAFLLRHLVGGQFY